ncbi:two-component system activity regulator YycH [Risungbinella massiliensis]|uniref:two-component system activity regulator YycH n=1 Tax=Risungbinella massiliensis TaxID=1329796 RepID=UPI0005CBDDA8|nr:two-component system activity regulator YycH [Risungbinella massiliensis]
MKKGSSFWKKNKERIKTTTLILLILASFALTGLLWYSSPPYTETTETKYQETPLIGKEVDNRQKEVFDLTAPPFLVVHQRNQHYLITKEKNQVYRDLIKTIHQDSDLTNVERKFPTPQEWRYILEEASSVEMQFFQDLTLEQVDSFFLSLLDSDGKAPLKEMGKISRILVWEDRNQSNPKIWFISDETHSVVQATMATTLVPNFHSQLVNAISNSPDEQVTPIYGNNNKPPWDPGSGATFSRVFYLPNDPWQVTRPTFETTIYSIEEMKKILFRRDYKIDAINNNNELIYLFNDQTLVYNQAKNEIRYTDNSNRDGEEKVISSQIETIQSEFMLKHYGWTGSYLLEKVLPEKKDTFVFRLLHEGIPVYAPKSTERDSQTQLDQILLTPDSSNASGVGSYQRSLEIIKQEKSVQSSTLPGRTQVLDELHKRNLPLTEVTQLYPIYQMRRSEVNTVEFVPYWKIQTVSGTEVLIGGES